MKLNKSFEQAVYVLTMLALQENHTPVKSRVLSDILEVSDSYLNFLLQSVYFDCLTLKELRGL